MTDDTPCPCGSGREYLDCCGRLLERAEPAETAEQLMRSRYTAYTQGREDYLLHTWHPSTRPELLRLAEASAVRWLGLRILRVEDGGTGDAEGRVEFVARHKLGGKASRLHEISRFVREDGQWLYLDGEIERTPESGR
jgi:SEC-C motif-containing protein